MIMKKIYFEPELEIIEISTEQFLMLSGPDVIDDDPTGAGGGVTNPGDILAPTLPGMPGLSEMPDLAPMPDL